MDIGTAASAPNSEALLSAIGEKGANEPLLYLTIARRIREQIMVGNYPAGSRLPSEVEMASHMGVARTSVREALKVLVSQGLIETTRGATGGSVVLELDHHDVMRFLEQNMQYLVSTRGCSAQEMDEVRELLEVSAAWMAATRRSPVQLDRLYASIPEIEADTTPTKAQIDTNLRFHYEILEATGNRLLHLFAEPVSIVIYSFYRSEEHHPDYYQQVLIDHQRIAQAIESRDATAARVAMSEHICNLRSNNNGSPRSPLAGLSFD